MSVSLISIHCEVKSKVVTDDDVSDSPTVISLHPVNILLINISLTILVMWLLSPQPPHRHAGRRPTVGVPGVSLLLTAGLTASRCKMKHILPVSQLVLVVSLLPVSARQSRWCEGSCVGRVQCRQAGGTRDRGAQCPAVHEVCCQTLLISVSLSPLAVLY